MRKTRVDPAAGVAVVFLAAAAAVVLVAVLPAAAFRTVPVVVLVVPGTAVAFDPVPTFLTTVEVLASLDTLARRPVRVAGRDVGGFDEDDGAATLLVRLAAVAVVAVVATELVVDEVVAFLVPMGRVVLALSAALASAPRAVFDAFTGDAGLEICLLEGDGGGRSRTACRTLVDVGERTWPVPETEEGIVGPARCFFLRYSISLA